MKAINRLKEYIDFKGVSNFAFEKQLELSNGYIGTQLKRNADLGEGVLLKVLDNCLDIDPLWLLTGKGEMLKGANLQTQSTNSLTTTQISQGLGMPKVVTVDRGNNDLIPLVNVKAAAGYLNGYADPEFIEHLPVIAVPGVNSGTHRAFEINGHSMSPTFHHRSIVIGSWVEKLSDIRDRYIYIVVSKTDGVVSKRVLNRIDERDNLVLISDNHNKTEYPNIILDPDDILELWRARLLLSHNFPEPVYWQDRFNDLEAEMTFLKHDLKTLQNKSLNAG